MRSASPALIARLAESTTTLAWLWAIYRTDGVVQGFTTLDREIELDYVTYSPARGFNPSATVSAIGTGMQGGQVEIIMDDAGVSKDDVLADRYADALNSLKVVDYMDLSAGAIDVFDGRVLTVAIDDERPEVVTFKTEGKLNRQRSLVFDIYSSTCRADLGDNRCRVDIDALKQSFTVTALIPPLGQQRFFIDLTEPDDYWNEGVILFETGPSTGIAAEITQSLATGRIDLYLPLPFGVAVGNTGTIWPGCDKTFTTCQQRYQNIVNFRGEPFMAVRAALLDEGNK